MSWKSYPSEPATSTAVAPRDVKLLILFPYRHHLPHPRLDSELGVLTMDSLRRRDLWSGTSTGSAPSRLFQYIILNAVVAALYYNLLRLRNYPAKSFRTVLFLLAPLGMFYHAISPLAIPLAVLLYTRSLAQAGLSFRRQIGSLPFDSNLSPSPAIDPSDRVSSKTKSSTQARCQAPWWKSLKLAATVIVLLYCSAIVWWNVRNDVFTPIETRMVQLGVGGMCAGWLTVVQILLPQTYPVDIINDVDEKERQRQLFLLRDAGNPVLIDVAASGVGFGLVLWTFHPKSFDIPFFAPSMEIFSVPIVWYIFLVGWIVLFALLLYRANESYHAAKGSNNGFGLNDGSPTALEDYWTAVVLAATIPLQVILFLLCCWCFLRGILDQFTIALDI